VKENIDFLEKNLERVNTWLQFAEAKNAAMIAFVVAMLAVIYDGNILTNEILRIIITIIYILSLFLSVISFYPKYKKNVFLRDGVYEVQDNLLFWKDISKYSVNEYLQAINTRIFKTEQGKFTEEQRMYAEELITNARIAKAKYDLFIAALVFVIIATVLLPIFIIICLI